VFQGKAAHRQIISISSGGRPFGAGRETVTTEVAEMGGADLASDTNCGETSVNTTMMRFAVIAAVGLASFAGSAYAQSRPQLPASLPGVAVLANSVRISYGDIDTRTADGMGVLRTRVNHAAVQVCRFHDGVLQEPLPEFQCRNDARAGAWEQYALNEARRQYASRDAQVIDLVAVPAMTR
jgi:UrcA family protein